MSRRLGSRDVLWLALLTGAFVVLCLNVVLGTRGFHRPHPGSVWRVLEAPGIALGWGGVALLVLAIPYALLTWMRGQGPGTVVAVVGAFVVALGIGGLAGTLTHPAAAGGGRLAGGLAHLLRETLGPTFAGIVCALMCLPGLLLALAPLLFQGATARTARPGTGGGVPAGPPRPGTPTVKSRYPERRMGPDGEELPMDLGGGDVGEIRVRPPTAAEADPDAIASLPASSSRRSRPIEGIRYADAEDAGGAPSAAEPGADGPATAPASDPGADLPDGVRFAPPAEAVATLDAMPAADEVPARAEVPAAGEDLSPPPAPSPLVPSAIEEVSTLDLEVEMPEEALDEAPRPAAAPTPIPEPTPAAERASPVPAADSDVPPGPPAPARTAEDAAAHAAQYRRRLAGTGLIGDGPPPEIERAHKPPRPRARSPRESAGRDAIAGLFTSLPQDELPAIAPAMDDVEAAVAAERAEAPVDAPGQTRLFEDGVDLAPGGRHPASQDPLYEASVAAALERGSASLVLLKRRLGVGYARAALLMEALVAEGVLGEMTASGSRPALITAAEYAARARRAPRA